MLVFFAFLCWIRQAPFGIHTVYHYYSSSIYVCFICGAFRKPLDYDAAQYPIHRIISKQSCWRLVGVNCTRYWWDTVVSITTLWFWTNECVKYPSLYATERRKIYAESYWKMIVILDPLNKTIEHWALMMNFHWTLVGSTVQCSVLGWADLNGVLFCFWRVIMYMEIDRANTFGFDKN